MPKFESSTSYDLPASVVFNAAAQAAQSLPGWRVVEVNQAGWYITASVSLNFWSYGENITVQIMEPSPGQPVMNVLSTSKFALFDFGKNRSNVNKYFAKVQYALIQYGNGQAPAATPGQAPAAAYCPGCGAPQKVGARFCTSCGQGINP